MTKFEKLVTIAPIIVVPSSLFEMAYFHNKDANLFLAALACFLIGTWVGYKQTTEDN